MKLLAVMPVSTSVLLPVMASALMVSSCRRVGYDYWASTTISGINIEVGLSQAHPFLAEYKRTVLIGNDKRFKLGIDSGGLSYINVFDTPESLVFQTFYTHILVVDIAMGKATLEKRPLTQTEIDSFVGAFDFVDLDDYQFVGGDENSTFNPAVVKGG